MMEMSREDQAAMAFANLTNESASEVLQNGTIECIASMFSALASADIRAAKDVLNQLSEQLTDERVEAKELEVAEFKSNLFKKMGVEV